MAINLPLVVGAALVDGINPCAFGVLIFLLAFLSKTIKNKLLMLTNGLVYIFGVFITYLAAGLILLPILKSLGTASVAAYYILALLIFAAGLLEIKDYFWYGRWFSLSIFPSDVKRIKTHKSSIAGSKYTAFTLGCIVALIELPCTGAIYIALLAIMSQTNLDVGNLSFLVIYNIIFVLPLLVILWLFYKGISVKKFENWRNKNKAFMRLITGLVLIGLAIWMLLFTV